ncbi:probable leucine-rich repeat receptor-like protein kinase At5g49770 isoform X1 [Papaver somniferum]|uniref:probable leucine-rich repeat receptor-like protein kinase At5g49770 isoform X1 n=1 Tax=Papaver somniferum TaxID=3469 RepID=UPI000E6F8403|nr:probable leucine-rich repeat receptor-like protein kinase At5g49770 isoform X1 [Papaver somniferum]
MMGRGILLFLLVRLFQFLVVEAATDPHDFAVLRSLKTQWQNIPPNWAGSDPCSEGWEGIVCTDSRVISIQLSTMGLKGPLSGDIGSLSELQSLDLSYNPGLTGPLQPSIGNLKKLTNLILVGCGFSGPIPSEIGYLPRLVFLSLNSNRFNGNIPPTIGSLSSLYWLDLADNQLSGSIPVSSGNTPGLDMLTHTKHFHFGKNQLSGVIPAQLFSANMNLIHVLFEDNQLTGSIPATLGLVKTLEVVRLDRNLLSGNVPTNLNKLIGVSELHLSNNDFVGPFPDLSGMLVLNSVDLSNNSFAVSDFPPYFSSLKSLTTLEAENTNLKGVLPPTLFTLPQLQTLNLKTNLFNGSLDIGSDFSDQLELVDLQNNSITGYIERGGYPNELRLMGNPVCGPSATAKFCQLAVHSSPPYSTPPNNCAPSLCPNGQNSSPNCQCSYPYSGTLFFRAPSFSDLENAAYYTSLQSSLQASFTTNKVPVDSISLSNPKKDADDYLEVSLQVFPSGKQSFSRSDIAKMGFMLSNQTFKPPKSFGPFFFIASQYAHFSESDSASGSKKMSLGIIVGASVGGFILLVLIFIGVYLFCKKRRVKTDTERRNVSEPRQSGATSWDPTKSSDSFPQLKGPKVFSSNELRKATNNFSEANDIGSGGYGKVYRGTLASGQLVAIKRSQPGSSQGRNEFTTEVELLSRVHHKNLVGLVGFCFEDKEQMLVYEFVPNGTLKGSLTGKSGIRLDWNRRLRVALGAAKGLSYLHDLANPPIIHRDIKTNNILLDERLNAKVADFGLSKPMGDSEDGQIVTQVKGTMGYLDPEYYMSNQLTAKSDVYSFGVVLLELLTARVPLEKGRYIVREVRVAMDRQKDRYGLNELLDSALGLTNPLKGLEQFVDLAMRCVEETGDERPTMSEAVKEIERIMQMAGMNTNADSASFDATSTRSSPHPYHSHVASFDYNGAFTPPHPY